MPAAAKHQVHHLSNRYIINHDIMNCTADGVVGNQLYSGRALGLSEPWDIIQMHPDLKTQWPKINEHYHRIGLSHTEKVICDLNLKELLDQVEDFRMQRLFDASGRLLPIFWYIAIIGYLLTLMTLYLPPPTTRRCLLVSFYSSMVALVLLGIFILTHPYSFAAGVGPDVFEWMMAVGGESP